jgi:hypothetical protein
VLRSDPRLQTALPLAPLTPTWPANRICSATGQSRGTSLNRDLRERGVFHGRRYGCTRPRRRAGQERVCQSPRRYGSLRFRPSMHFWQRTGCYLKCPCNVADGSSPNSRRYSTAKRPSYQNPELIRTVCLSSNRPVDQSSTSGPKASAHMRRNIAERPIAPVARSESKRRGTGRLLG